MRLAERTKKVERWRHAGALLMHAMTMGELIDIYQEPEEVIASSMRNLEEDGYIYQLDELFVYRWEFKKVIKAYVANYWLMDIYPQWYRYGDMTRSAAWHRSKWQQARRDQWKRSKRTPRTPEELAERQHEQANQNQRHQRRLATSARRPRRGNR